MLKFVNHVNRDTSIHREANFRDQAGPSVQRGMHPEGNFAREFLEKERQFRPEMNMHMPELEHELDHIRFEELGPKEPGGTWAEEFHLHHQHQQHLPLHLDEEFERIYNQQHAPPGAWDQEFMQNPANFQPLEPGEFQQFERLYQSVAPAAKITELSDEWAEEFAQAEAKDKGKAWEQEFAENHSELEEMWKRAREFDYDEELGDEEYFDGSMVNPFEAVRTEVKPYEFEQDNPFLQHPSPYEEGLKLMDNGNLSDAALAFEAAVQKTPEHSEAWFRLGSVQQENEKEQAAISALSKAVALDPSHTNASLALAVSFTNEGAENQALDSLENWLHTKYPNFKYVERQPNQIRHEHVVNQYLQIVQQFPTIDADVQVCLGVLFNISSEYDKAVDCFASALQVRPDDYILLNRYGATLANSGKSEQAIGVYYEALKIKPSYVRARYNLGVSCINIGCYKEAAEHFLGALALHGDNNQQRNVSVSLWDTLRRTLLMMDRRDLFEKSHDHNLDVFRPEFEF